MGSRAIGSTEDITNIVIRVSVAVGVAICAEQLPLLVVGVSDGTLPGCGIGGNIARRGCPLRVFIFGWLLTEKKCVTYLQALCLVTQTQLHWDNPKPLKVSGIVLTSAVVSQRRCLLV